MFISFSMENVIVNLHIFLGCGIRGFINWNFNLRNFIRNIRRTYLMNFCSRGITAKGIYIKPSLK
ncbi:asparagine synthetase (plasmid) [Bacillus thuringiensis serovar tolworthi]|uniref:Asparagine synthetase n=1 Tax=Bacillus thuringiensis subsp. tolworthi TaxID=1442 RepID=A0A9W4ABN7_BACTO|nr:asparagine synthetase [Bacillus thuringiensis serovar tolworthi]